MRSLGSDQDRSQNDVSSESSLPFSQEFEPEYLFESPMLSEYSRFPALRQIDYHELN